MVLYHIYATPSRILGDLLSLRAKLNATSEASIVPYRSFVLVLVKHN
jgi:hypothetical protein